MSSRTTAFEAKNRLGSLLDRVQAGEEITITRHGHPVAVLSPPASGDRGAVTAALQTLKDVRQTLLKRGIKIRRNEVRAWISEGRR